MARSGQRPPSPRWCASLSPALEERPALQWLQHQEAIFSHVLHGRRGKRQQNKFTESEATVFHGFWTALTSKMSKSPFLPLYLSSLRISLTVCEVSFPVVKFVWLTFWALTETTINYTSSDKKVNVFSWVTRYFHIFNRLSVSIKCQFSRCRLTLAKSTSYQHLIKWKWIKSSSAAANSNKSAKLPF